MSERGGSNLPAAPAQIPGLPETPIFIEFGGFDGLDTKPPRPGVAENNVPWSQNLMPLGKNNIRAIPDCADTPFYTAPGSLTIIHYDFFGLQPDGVNTGPHCIVFLSDGSAVDHNIDAATDVTIAPPGTFAVGGLPPRARQYGTKYLVITSIQSVDAFWIWDGSVFYGPGTISPEIDLTSGGIGYTSAPAVTAIGGSGSGAAFTAQVQDGNVIEVTPTAAGSGWQSADATKLLLLFSGGGSGTTAWGTAQVVNGAIVSATIISGGTGFTSVPSIVITDPTGVGAAIIVTGLSGGVITGLQVQTCGHDYTNPSIATSGGGGTGFSGTVSLQNGVIAGYNVGSVGSGYGEAPQVFFLSSTGSGASATATLSGGTITGIQFGASQFTGSGYPTLTTVLVGFRGGNGPASGTVRLMPFGVSGNAVEVYQSRVWTVTTVHGVKLFWTAPGSVSNFSPTDGGGILPATQSNLTYQWSEIIESGGFLYLIGDSSVQYISGVTTSGAPAITTFSNLNVDPQIGSPWRDSCMVYSRAIMIANPFGVHAIYGGAVQKVSTPLDGVWGTASVAPLDPSGPTSAVAEIFGVHVFLILKPIIDPVTGLTKNMLFCWDGKRWFPALQRVDVIHVGTLEWGSEITAVGNTGTQLFKLFQTPTTDTPKILKSKLTSKAMITIEKKSWMLYALWKSTEASTLNFTIDTENSAVPVTQGPFVGDVGADATWARSKSADALGYTLGFTLTSDGADFTLIDILLVAQDRRLRT